MKNSSFDLTTLSAAAVVDSGVIIEYLSLDPNNKTELALLDKLDQLLFENQAFKILLLSASSRIELLYIFCRRFNWERAKELSVNILKNFQVLRNAELEELAAQFKCRFPLALSDCFTLAIAQLFAVPCFFLPEQEFSGPVIESIRNDSKIDLRIISDGK